MRRSPALNPTVPASRPIALDPVDWAASADLLAAGDADSARLAARIRRSTHGTTTPVALVLSAGDRALLHRAHQRRLDALLTP